MCSVKFSVKNGVKQGGVISPVLFYIYIDKLLLELIKSGFGCFIGEVFRTDAKRFYYLSHAICYSYGADNKMAAAAILKNRKISISRPRLERF